MHSEETLNEQIEKIIKIKNIKNLDIKKKLKLIIGKSNRIAKYKSELKSLYQEKINKDDKKHMKMLYDIWFHFFKDEKDIHDIDKKWRKINNFNIILIIVNIGFQGKDPLTDFRGSGLLGLKHLWQFSLIEPKSDRVFKVATDKKTWYFFAATGINISGKVIEFIEQGNCDKFFYEQNEDINLYLFTQKLYNEFFCKFNDMWIERGYTDFMKVNSTLEEFMKTRTKYIFENLIMNKKLF